MSLYRAYRPSSFDDVIGQDAVVRALQAALRADQLSHALVLTGPRGVGKTTLARLVAKGANCQEGPTDTPCGACESCLSIDSDSSPDVFELDAASNGGVDDARALRDQLHVAPIAGRRKVFILDEAHMLTAAAQNALLKAMEEPPDNVHFILATTAADKLLDTIRSRCHRYALRRPDAGEIGRALQRVADAEKLTLQDGVVSLLSAGADGSFRDALTSLDQLLPLADDNNVIHTEDAQQLTGRPVDQAWVDLLSAIADGNSGAALEQIRALSSSGFDMDALLLAFAQFLRLVLYAQQLGEVPEQLHAEAEVREMAAQVAARLPELRLWALLQGLDEARRQATFGSGAAMAVEIAVVAAANDWRDAADAAAPAAAKPAPAPKLPRSAAASKPKAAPTDPDPAPASESQKAPEPVAAPQPASQPIEPDTGSERATVSQAVSENADPTPEGERSDATAPVQGPAEPDTPKEGPSQQPVEQSGEDALRSEDLPTPAIAAMRFPLMRLALRSTHPDLYLTLRTARARYDEGKLLVETMQPLNGTQQRAVKAVLARMVDGPVWVTLREQKAARRAVAPMPAPDAAQISEIMGQFGLVEIEPEPQTA